MQPLQEEKLRTAVEAKVKLFGALPDELRKVLGHQATTRGLGRLHELFQCRALNKRLVYAILEALLIRVRWETNHLLRAEPITPFAQMFPKNNMADVLNKIHDAANLL